MIDWIYVLMLVKSWLLVHSAFFLFLLRISFKNVDRRLSAIERKIECG